MNERVRRLCRFVVLGVVTLSLAACGSSGGGSGGDIGGNGGGGGGGTTDKPLAVFSGDQLDPNNWQFLHFVRKIENGQWVSEIAQRGSDLTNSVSLIPQRNSLSSFQVDVNVTEARSEGARIRAFIQGRFYKDSTLSGRTGEIIANIDIRQKEDGDALILSTFVIRCEDASCDNVSTLFEDDTSLGTATLGQNHRLSVTYNQTARTFTFGFDNKTIVFDNTPVFAAASENPFVIWGTWIDRIDPDADPAESGFIASRFDNLSLNNGTQVLTFTEGSIFERGRRFVRQVDDGMAELEINGAGPQSNLFITLQIANSIKVTSSLQATVSIDADTPVNGTGTEGGTNTVDPSAQLSIFNEWYHSGSATGGRTGDVCSLIRIRHDGQVRLLSFKCTNSDCSQFERLLNTIDEIRAVPLNQSHTLELSFDGTNLTYAVDNQTHVFNPTLLAPNSGLPAGSPFPSIRARLNDLSDSGDAARMRLTIDDVKVNGQLHDDFSPLGKVEPIQQESGGDGGSTSGSSGSASVTGTAGGG